ncbi:hypothetical protein HDU87_005555 [Geranomyces variabilis]|uniref:Uncharacterized protein n=1 Tax=Geranomyces variabilis TaxID=109894 RepID=A0AAD5THC3_9FUNG|nr:hypothetical protein HDU87_005555 [Geranomyces variabilis]
METNRSRWSCDKEGSDVLDDKLWNHPGVAGDAVADERMFWRMMRGSLWQAWEKLMPDTNYGYDARNFPQQTKEGYAAASKKYGDALGRDPTTQKERILMESSSGLDKEDLEHTFYCSMNSAGEKRAAAEPQAVTKRRKENPDDEYDSGDDESDFDEVPKAPGKITLKVWKKPWGQKTRKFGARGRERGSG